MYVYFNISWRLNFLIRRHISINDGRVNFRTKFRFSNEKLGLETTGRFKWREVFSGLPSNPGLSIKNMQLPKRMKKGKRLSLVSRYCRNKTKVRHDREERHGGW